MFARLFSALVFLHNRLKEPTSMLAMAYLADKFDITVGDIAPLITTGLGFAAFFIPEAQPLVRVKLD
jgi:hypothetical protein